MKKTLEERIAEVVREDIAIEPWSPEWSIRFEAEAQHLRDTFPGGLIRRIEHFGSTAVPGLAAKPIVDMLIEISGAAEARDRIVPVLETQGYDYFWRPAGGDLDFHYHWFIKRDAQGRRTHHLHMIEADAPLWARLAFRDYLRAFPEAARRYADLKITLATQHPNDRVAYHEAKTAFVVETTAQALVWASSLDLSAATGEKRERGDA